MPALNDFITAPTGLACRRGERARTATVEAFNWLPRTRGAGRARRIRPVPALHPAQLLLIGPDGTSRRGRPARSPAPAGGDVTPLSPGEAAHAAGAPRTATLSNARGRSPAAATAPSPLRSLRCVVVPNMIRRRAWCRDDRRCFLIDRRAAVRRLGLAAGGQTGRTVPRRAFRPDVMAAGTRFASSRCPMRTCPGGCRTR